MNSLTVDTIARNPATAAVFLKEALEEACALYAKGASEAFVEAVLTNAEIILEMRRADTLRRNPAFLTYCIAMIREVEGIEHQRLAMAHPLGVA